MQGMALSVTPAMSLRKLVEAISNSNLSWDTDYPDGGIPWFFLQSNAGIETRNKLQHIPSVPFPIHY
jgi:hypothetical protein